MAAAESPRYEHKSASPTDEAIKYVCPRHLHQVLWLSENDSHGKLRVTFSTTSNFSDPSLPVIFVCPPMFGSRWMVVDLEHLAISSDVRVVSLDRYRRLI